MKKIFIILIFCFLANLSGFGQNKINQLNECWIFTVSETHSRTYDIKYNFYKNGTFESFTNKSDRNRKYFKMYEEGTYFYQSATNEMFITITTLNKKSTKKRKCFRIVVNDDSEIPNAQIYYNWTINNNGKSVPLGESKTLGRSYILSRRQL